VVVRAGGSTMARYAQLRGGGAAARPAGSGAVAAASVDTDTAAPAGLSTPYSKAPGALYAPNAQHGRGAGASRRGAPGAILPPLPGAPSPHASSPLACGRFQHL
jgi:hypothetical protein